MRFYRFSVSDPIYGVPECIAAHVKLKQTKFSRTIFSDTAKPYFFLNRNRNIIKSVADTRWLTFAKYWSIIFFRHCKT